MGKEEIGLGMKVEDLVTGYTGIAEAIATYLHGCRRITVQAPLGADGKVPESYSIDEPQLKIVDGKPIIVVVIPEQTIKLGTRVKDPVNGLIGIVTGRCMYLNGCATVLVQPKIKDAHKDQLSGVWIAEARVEPLGEPVVKEGSRKTGGPQVAPSISTPRP